MHRNSRIRIEMTLDELYWLIAARCDLRTDDVTIDATELIGGDKVLRCEDAKGNFAIVVTLHEKEEDA